MNSTIELIFTIAGAALVLLSAYGAIKRDRRLFLSGFCFFSFLPIIGEYMAYHADKVQVHLLMIVLFVVQFLLMFPDKNTYARDNKPAVAAVTKIGLAVLVINAAATLFIFHLNNQVPLQFGYYHVAFILILLYVLAKGAIGTASWNK
jgi:uncharacterized membrane protein